ncbi:MAG: hypothetical protein A2W00_06805 [Candidatus Eisenbacteria bacterium RBG_16_71_46]|nr:MAG: hypothetical protein A2W00_06805 [Candidatus Eisenbacteria bacterium RBG_16_71_46]
MAARRGGGKLAQAWIELRTDDPAAVSALAVARAHLASGRGLEGLRRLRLVEVRGSLPGREVIAELLHRSTQFYNPHKERCWVRLKATDPVPAEPGDQVVLVVERGAVARPAAERWWAHETGKTVEVSEGVAWVMRFAAGEAAAARALELADLRDRRNGLLCNPNSQSYRLAEATVPLPWIEREPAPRTRGRETGRRP